MHPVSKDLPHCTPLSSHRWEPCPPWLQFLQLLKADISKHAEAIIDSHDQAVVVLHSRNKMSRASRKHVMSRRAMEAFCCTAYSPESCPTPQTRRTSPAAQPCTRFPTSHLSTALHGLSALVLWVHIGSNHPTQVQGTPASRLGRQECRRPPHLRFSAGSRHVL